ncbi:MAG: hypothetical protein M1819_002029 [Sarea resinae]|nr:MAG: hypothetical protein M1819_002029 [Sarea resinae]
MNGQATRQAAHRPATVTQTQTPTPAPRITLPTGTLRLRGEPVEERHIAWAEDVVDNEGMGKKSSKVCCIYHKPRAVDESSSEDSSSSSSDSDSDSSSEPDNSRARMPGQGRGRRRRPSHPHSHDHDGDDGDGGDDDDDGGCGHDHGSPPRKPARQRRRASPNAYEKMPKAKGMQT